MQPCLVKKRDVPSSMLSRFVGVFAIAFLCLLIFQPSAAGQANVQGTWQTLSTQAPINPIHLALMHNGQVLIVSGSGNYPPDTSYMAGVWNPQTDVFTTQPLTWDMFCNGMVVLPDGRPFIMSGTLQYDPFEGYVKTSSYNPATGSFVDLQPMAHGRWYPTATTLGNGKVMVFSGLDENGNTNTTVEIYTVGVGWSVPYQAPWTPPLYPRMHLLPNGNVFYSGSTTSSALFNPSTQVWTTGVATTNYSGTRTYGSSVLLPLTPANNYDPRVMIMGGGNPATATTEIIDLGATTPAWVYGPKMSEARIEMDAVMLPTGNVLVLNGSVNDEDATTASLNADLYNTATNTFSSAGAGSYARLYHSGALLLPDATVLVLGGNPERGTYQPAMEIYTPSYLYNSSGALATRPTITSVTPGVIGYGSTFQIQTPNASTISSAVLVRAGAPTHAFDMDQRLVGLTFTAGSGVLTATAPPNGNIAPPGYYLLFLINSSGVPSVAQFVQLSLNPTDQPPTGTITVPTGPVTILPGQSVSFSGTGTSPTGSIASYSWVFPGGSPATSSVANPGSVTFSTPGAYPVSLTVTDNLGVTDPNPPTQTITVSPDFSVVASPTIQSIVPGGTANVDVTVIPTGQFTGTVTFTISGLPSGVTASLNPTSVSGSGTALLTLTASSSTAVGSSTITVAGTSGTETNSSTFSLNVSTSLPTANAISVDFVGLGTSMATTETAGVVQVTNWNNATGASSSSPMSLMDETGASTKVTLAWSSDDVWDQSITDQPGNVRMMKGYLDNGNQDTSTVTVSGLPSVTNGFTVYVYAQGASNGTTNTGIYQISGAGITTSSVSLTYNSNFNGTFTQATASNPIGNYVVFTIPNVAGFTLSAIPSTASNGYERAPINGIQIVPINPPNPNFTITTTQNSSTVGLGYTTTYNVNVAALNGFTGAVTLTAAGLPSGATASFSPVSITTSGSSVMTVSAPAGTPTGNSTVTITGTAGTITNSTSVTLTVSGPNFTVSATPSSDSVTPGSTATYTVSVAPLYGYNGQVTWTASGLPTGASASFSPAVISTGSGSSTMTVTTSASTPGGSSNITIMGTGTEELSQTTSVALNVTVPDFTFTVTPSSNSVISGGTATYTVNVAPINSFSGTVTLALSGLPSGASASFSPTSIATSGTSTLTITTLASTPTGTSTLAVTGTSGSLTHTVNPTLSVTSTSSIKVISIDFVGMGNPMASTETAGVVAKSYWNQANGATNSTGLSLVDETGAATSASVTWTADDIWDEPITDAPGNVRMMEGYLDTGNQDTTVVKVTGLPSDPNGYGVYVYANGGITSGTDTGTYQISGTGITTNSVALTYSSDFNGTFTQATPTSATGNYVILTIPGVSGFTLSAIPTAATSGYLRAPINGIQIVPLGPPTPNFTISETPAAQTVNAGSSTTYTVTVAPQNSFSGTVNLTATGLPTGATPTFSPASISNGSGTSTLTVATAAGSPASSTTFTTTGTSGSLVNSTTANLNVVAPDFSISVSPGTTTVAPGATASYTVTVAPLNGFTGTVTLSVAGQPSGDSPTFSPTSITTSGTSTLSIITGSTTGSSTLSITGTSGSLTHSATAILNASTAGSSTNPISINFVGTDVNMASTETAGVVAKTNWNNAVGAVSSAPMPLVDNTGTATNVTVSWSADDVWEESITDAAGNVRMMKGYLDNGYEDTTVVTVAGLPSDPNGFKIYVYADGAITSGTDTGIYQVSGTGITTSSITLTYSSNFSGTFTQATSTSATGNYLILTIPNVSGFKLSAIPSSSTSGYNRAPINGIQIIPQ